MSPQTNSQRIHGDNPGCCAPADEVIDWSVLFQDAGEPAEANRQHAWTMMAAGVYREGQSGGVKELRVSYCPFCGGKLPE